MDEQKYRVTEMGKPTIAKKTALICAVCYCPDVVIDAVHHTLEELFGPVALSTDPFPFLYTHYYEKEMGENLYKKFLCFQRLIEPMDIVNIKLETNDLEEKFAISQRRQVNLDPGYMEIPKLILATTKNFSHRIYLGKGIYGDIQLVWRHGRFHVNPWTYPDYQEKINLEFFTRVREWYIKTMNNDQ
ncbi:DUF4416 family protein [candidate division KSB1 bacterium]|nr:DUF4416 family protein [candidate division KSB1 bacterium]